MAQCNHRVVIGFHGLPEAGQPRPLVGAVHRLLRAHVGVPGGQVDAELEDFLDVRRIAGNGDAAAAAIATLDIVHRQCLLVIERQIEEAPGLVESVFDHAPRHAVADHVEKADALAGLGQQGHRLRLPRLGFRERVIGTVQLTFAKPGYRFA